MKEDRQELKKAYGYVNKAYHAVEEILWDDDSSKSDIQEVEDLMEEINLLQDKIGNFLSSKSCDECMALAV